MGKILFLDLETTGLSPSMDEVIEIALVQLNEDWSYKTILNTFCKPRQPIRKHITAINGISNEMVDGYPHFSSFKDSLKLILANSVIVGHNIKSFDLKFFDQLFSEIEWRDINLIVLDTLHEARANIVAQNHTLDHLCSIFNIHSPTSHRAEVDCVRNIELLRIISSLGSNKSEILKSLNLSSSSNYLQYKSYFDKPSKLDILLNSVSDIVMLTEKKYNTTLDRNILDGYTISVTGECGMERDEIKYLLTYAGAKISSGINSKTNLLIFGNEYGSKLKVAKDKNIPIISSYFLSELLVTGDHLSYVEKSQEILSQTKPYRS